MLVAAGAIAEAITRTLCPADALSNPSFLGQGATTTRIISCLAQLKRMSASGTPLAPTQPVPRPDAIRENHRNLQEQQRQPPHAVILACLDAVGGGWREADHA
jgi:hypothetical protein